LAFSFPIFSFLSAKFSSFRPPVWLVALGFAPFYNVLVGQSRNRSRDSEETQKNRRPLASPWSVPLWLCPFLLLLFFTVLSFVAVCMSPPPPLIQMKTCLGPLVCFKKIPHSLPLFFLSHRHLNPPCCFVSPLSVCFRLTPCPDVSALRLLSRLPGFECDSVWPMPASKHSC